MPAIRFTFAEAVARGDGVFVPTRTPLTVSNGAHHLPSLTAVPTPAAASAQFPH